MNMPETFQSLTNENNTRSLSLIRYGVNPLESSRFKGSKLLSTLDNNGNTRQRIKKAKNQREVSIDQFNLHYILC